MALATRARDVRLWAGRCPLPTVTPGGGRDVCCCVSGPRRRHAGPAAFPVAVAGEVGPGHSALRGPGLLVAGVRRAERGRARRHLVYPPVPASVLRLERRGAPLDLAGAVLRLRGAGHRPLPAVQPARRPHLSGPPAGRVPASGYPAAWSWSSGGCWPSRTTWSSACSRAGRTRCGTSAAG